MKIPLVGWLFLTLLLAGGERVHWRGGYDRALEKARQHGKDLLLVLVRKGSSASRELVRRIGNDPETVRQLGSRFVPVIVVSDRKESYPVELYYTLKFPTLYIVDAKRELPRQAPCIGMNCAQYLREYLLETAGKAPSRSGKEKE